MPEKIIDYSEDGNHLPKKNNSETIERITKILKKNPNPVLYDRPEDDDNLYLLTEHRDQK